jgi:hypothetical protein
VAGVVGVVDGVVITDEGVVVGEALATDDMVKC